MAEPALRLSWRAPEACPESAWVLARVARYLDRAIAPSDDAPLTAEVSIEATPTGEFAARLALASADGRRERSLTDRDCVLVADAVAFIVAVAIDPTVRTGDAPLTTEERAHATRPANRASDSGPGPGPGPGPGSGPGSGPGPGPGPSSGPRSASESESDSASESESESDSASESDSESGSDSDSPGPPLHIGWALGAQAGIAVQPLPGLAPGVLVHGAMRLGRFARTELAVGYWPTQSLALPTDRTVDVGFDHAFAAIAGCALASSAGSQLGACLRLQTGAVRGHGSELSDGHDRALPHVALALGPLLMQTLSKTLALRFELAASLALVRPSFKLDTGATVYDAGIVGVAAMLGGELRID